MCLYSSSTFNDMFKTRLFLKFFNEIFGKTLLNVLVLFYIMLAWRVIGTFSLFLSALLFLHPAISQQVQPINKTIKIVMYASDPLTITPYDPSPINLPIGSTVTWINNDAVLHTVTSFAGSFDSGIIPPGEKFTYTFSEMGYYTYYCRLHPNMNGVIAIG